MDLVDRLLNYELDGTGMRREAAVEIMALTDEVEQLKKALYEADEYCRFMHLYEQRPAVS
jgi:hypothetical protein